MSDNKREQLLEKENLRLSAEITKLRELVIVLEQQRDSIYWEYERIRYSLNEQLTPRLMTN